MFGWGEGRQAAREHAGAARVPSPGKWPAVAGGRVGVSLRYAAQGVRV